jgi:hypothetical protein
MNDFNNAETDKYLDWYRENYPEENERVDDGMKILQEMATISLEDSPIERVNFWVINRLQAKYDLMKSFKEMKSPDEIHLCMDEIALDVVVEFGFRGNRQQVFEQLEDLLSFRKIHPYKEVHRKELIAQADKFSAHRAIVRSNPFRVKKLLFYDAAVGCMARKVGSQGMIDGLFALSKKMEETRLENIRQRHLKRECQCFYNE